MSGGKRVSLQPSAVTIFWPVNRDNRCIRLINASRSPCAPSVENSRRRLRKVTFQYFQNSHYHWQSAEDVCNSLLEHAARDDDRLRRIDEEDRIDDKIVLIIKRSRER